MRRLLFGSIFLLGASCVTIPTGPPAEWIQAKEYFESANSQQRNVASSMIEEYEGADKALTTKHKNSTQYKVVSGKYSAYMNRMKKADEKADGVRSWMKTIEDKRDYASRDLYATTNEPDPYQNLQLKAGELGGEYANVAASIRGLSVELGMIASR